MNTQFSTTTPLPSTDNLLLGALFDLFMQVDRSTRHSEAGLGIGLALVRSFVEAHGGRVNAASAGLGRGSEFTVRLPIV